MELNLVSWNDVAPRYDLRDWALGHEKMGKGITLTVDEAESLYNILSKYVYCNSLITFLFLNVR